MGMILNATCAQCGFKQEVYFGCSIDETLDDVMVPALDLEGCELLVRWYSEKETTSGLLTFYNDPALYKGEVSDFSISWGEIILNPTNNFCPECNRFAMEFKVVLLYD